MTERKTKELKPMRRQLSGQEPSTTMVYKMPHSYDDTRNQQMPMPLPQSINYSRMRAIEWIECSKKNDYDYQVQVSYNTIEHPLPSTPYVPRILHGYAGTVH